MARSLGIVVQEHQVEITPDLIRSTLAPHRDRLREFDRDTTPAEIDRILSTLSRIPDAKSPDDHLVDIGGTILWLILYRNILGYRRLSLVQSAGFLSWARCDEGWLDHEFGCRFVGANIDRNSYAIPDADATCVVSFEVLEHLPGDPMHFVSEANRILTPGGFFYLTTPNVLNAFNVVNYLFGEHPFGWSVYTGAYGDRHNREYTPAEIDQLLRAGGFSVNSLETLTHHLRGSRFKRATGQAICLFPALAGRVPMRHRGALIHARATKKTTVRDRYPPFLYEMFGADKVS